MTMACRLAEGVKVAALVPDLACRLRLNSGVEHASPNETLPPYKHDAVFPKEDWKELTTREASILTAIGSTPLACATVQLVEVPLELLEISRELGFQELKGQAEVEQIASARPEAFHRFMGMARRFGERLLTRNNGFSSQSVRCESQTGLRSATLDQRSRRYIGLHIDNWDNLPMHLRDNSRSRLILNLGKEPRFVVFVNLTVAQIARRMAAAVQLPQEISGFDCLGSFFSTFPGYPVAQLRIDPGEAYIAPVDNIFHDGTTTCRQSADITLSMLGHFGVGTTLPELAPGPVRT